MEKVYAQALWHLIRDGAEPKKAVTKLHEALVRRGHTALLRKIARAYQTIATHEQKRSTVTLLIASHKDEANTKKEVAHALTQLHLGDRKVITHIDHTLIGGWRIEGREHLLDASYKKFLLDIYHRATNH